jgi:hypothetical protein
VRTLLAAALVLATRAGVGTAQAKPPAVLNWWADDSANIAFVTTHGRAWYGTNAIVWAPADSLDPAWLAAFSDSLDGSLGWLKAFMGAPYDWQRIENRPVVFYLGPGRFISHASGRDAVFISLTRIRQRDAPALHEASHELLAPPAPFAPWEYPDSATEERIAAHFPFWLSEGLPDYLAQATSAATGFHEGDVFDIGGLALVDSVCAARLSASPRQAEILEKVGGQGRLEALYTTDRGEVAPTFYACSQSLTRYLVDRIGIRSTVLLMPAIKAGSWQAELEAAAGQPVATLRDAWLVTLGLAALVKAPAPR